MNLHFQLKYVGEVYGMQVYEFEKIPCIVTIFPIDPTIVGIKSYDDNFTRFDIERTFRQYSFCRVYSAPDPKIMVANNVATQNIPDEDRELYIHIHTHLQHKALIAQCTPQSIIPPSNPLPVVIEEMSIGVPSSGDPVADQAEIERFKRREALVAEGRCPNDGLGMLLKPDEALCKFCGFTMYTVRITV